MKTLSARPEDYCFIDFETRTDPNAADSDGDLKQAGTYRYTKNSFPIVLTYAIGNREVRCVAPDNFKVELPGELHEFYHRAVKRQAWFVAWNMGFDRNVWNNWLPSRPLAPEMTLDAMAQGLAANLPPDLESASRALGGAGKQKDGKKLIQLFSPVDGALPISKPDEWDRFKSYAMQDIDALRYVWSKTRPLPPSEWEEYWASERINDRGCAVDTDYCRQAQLLSYESVAWANTRLQALTGIPGIRVTMPKRIALWVESNLDYAEARGLMSGEAAIDELDDDVDEFVEEGENKISLKRQIIRRVLTFLATKELDDKHKAIVEVLEIREFGGSSSPVKFKKIADQADGDRLKGQYVFNGAGQTGRFSSKGVQIHNLPRESIGEKEEAAITDIGLSVHEFTAKYGSASRALPKLIKPAFIAEEGKVLVWADWSNIEARVNPWLAMSRAGNIKLDVFRHADAHPDQPDVYSHTAADLLGCFPREVTKAQRQSHGKVPELSLGFGGSTGALLNMATNYGEYVSDEQAVRMVEQWRKANPWARSFWDTLWDAIENAVQNHKVVFKAGRVSYLYEPKLLGGSLLCALPSGRILTYPQCKWEQVEVEDKKTKEKYMRTQLTYRKGYGRAALWYGKACENVVQATAGSLLRDALVILREDETWMPVVLHTHDDICVEVDEDRADEAAAALVWTMTNVGSWSGGLPLAADATTNWYLSKQAGRKVSVFTGETEAA